MTRAAPFINIGLLLLSVWTGYGSLAADALLGANPDKYLCITVLIMMPIFAIGAVSTFGAKHTALTLPSWRRFSVNWSRDPLQCLAIRASSSYGDALTPSNDYNLAAERGRSAFDFRRRLTTSLLYELPIGKGRMLLGNANRGLNALVGGWQLGTILTLQDGFPLSVFCGAGSIQNGGNARAAFVIFKDRVALHHVSNRPRSLENRAELTDTAQDNPVPS